MKVKKISIANVEVNVLPELLDKEKISFQTIDNVNQEVYPYRSKVESRIAYSDDAVLLHFNVKEASARAKYGESNGSVWAGSCVEFFSVPADDGIYYNIECDCIGTILIGAGVERNDRGRASQEVVDQVRRWASLEHQPFNERIEECDWEVALIIPYTAPFKYNITSLDGKTITANFYKCRDELQTPHFLSWNPIKIEKPDSHRSDFFGTLEFEWNEPARAKAWKIMKERYSHPRMTAPFLYRQTIVPILRLHVLTP